MILWKTIIYLAISYWSLSGGMLSIHCWTWPLFWSSSWHSGREKIGQRSNHVENRSKVKWTWPLLVIFLAVWAKFSLVWLSLVFEWALFRTINVDQRGWKTESERYQRLLAMTIWTGYVGSTLINVYGFGQDPHRTRGSTKPKKTWPWKRENRSKIKKKTGQRSN